MEDFEFVCWRCLADCTVRGKPKGFWTTTHYELPTEWECCNCGAINITPED